MSLAVDLVELLLDGPDDPAVRSQVAHLAHVYVEARSRGALPDELAELEALRALVAAALAKVPS